MHSGDRQTSVLEPGFMDLGDMLCYTSPSGFGRVGKLQRCRQDYSGYGFCGAREREIISAAGPAREREREEEVAMPWPQVVSIIANLVGVLAPVAVVLTKFGTGASVSHSGPEAMTQVLYIGLAVLFAFACSLAGSILTRKGNAPTLLGLAKLVIDLHQKRRPA